MCWFRPPPTLALHVLRVERLLAAALDAHAEGFAFQLGAVGFQRLLEDVVDVGISAIFHLQNMVDAGNARQGIGDDRPLVFIFGANFDMIPVTDDRQRFIILLQDVANIGREILIKRKRTDWLLMVISGNNLMINFMAVFVVR